MSVQAEYDEIGNLVRVEDPNGNVRRFEYDLLGRIVAQVEDTDDGEVIERRTYDGRGLQTSMTTPREIPATGTSTSIPGSTASTTVPSFRTASSRTSTTTVSAIRAIPTPTGIPFSTLSTIAPITRTRANATRMATASATPVSTDTASTSRR